MSLSILDCLPLKILTAKHNNKQNTKIHKKTHPDDSEEIMQKKQNQNLTASLLKNAFA